MSDFDKEAEREKLREKYGDESDERAATRQMSELLLKGATMTNKHCDTCGDPVFRYDGQEFCPTCQGQDGTYGDGQASESVDETTAGETADESSADGTGTATGERPVEVDTPDTATAPEHSTGNDQQPETSGQDRAQTRAEASESDPGKGAASERGHERGRREPGTSRERSSRETGRPAAPRGESDGDRQAGRRSLERALARFARAAAESDDPRVARDHLAAAREAAEALSALRR